MDIFSSLPRNFAYAPESDQPPNSLFPVVGSFPELEPVGSTMPFLGLGGQEMLDDFWGQARGIDNTSLSWDDKSWVFELSGSPTGQDLGVQGSVLHGVADPLLSGGTFSSVQGACKCEGKVKQLESQVNDLAYQVRDLKYQVNNLTSEVTSAKQSLAIEPQHTTQLLNVIEIMASQNSSTTIVQNFQAPASGVTAISNGDIQVTQNNYPTEQKPLADAATEIQNLLQQLQKNNPEASEEQQKAWVNAGVKQTVKEQAISAIKAGGNAVIEHFFSDNAYVKVGKAIIEGWSKD